MFEATYDLYSGHESYERLSQGIEAGLAFEMDVAEFNVDNDEYLKQRYRVLSSRSKRFDDGKIDRRNPSEEKLENQQSDFEIPKNKIILGSEGSDN